MPKFKDTKLEKFEKYEKLYNTSPEYYDELSDIMPHVNGELSNGKTIKSNLHQLELEDEGGNQYFMVEDEEMKAALKGEKSSAGIHMIKFEDFAMKYKTTFYIRVIRKEHTKSERIFADEVLSMIPVALKKQSAKVDKAALQRLRLKWKTVDGVFRTMDEEELNKILEKFNVDKSKITLVPDPNYEYDFLREHRRSGIISFKTRSPNNIIVMDPLQAAFYSFHFFLLLNYSGECENEIPCKVKIGKTIIETLEGYMNMDQSSFIPLGVVSRKVDEIRCMEKLLCSKCQFLTYFFFDNKNYCENVSTGLYHADCEECGLTKYPNFIIYGGETIPVWMASIFLAGAFFQKFYSRKETNIRKFLSLQFDLIVPPEISVNEFYLDFVKHVSMGTEESWPAPGSDVEKRMKLSESLGISLNEFSIWIEAAEKQWQLDGSGCDPEKTLFPEMS